MVTRPSTLQPFDPSAFHRSAEMNQSGWAEREVRQNRSKLHYTLTRLSSSITFILGFLLVLLLRPVNVMDTRDVVVSLVAIAASWIVAYVPTRLVMGFLRTSGEVDRIATWSIALVVAFVVASTGIVADFSRDVDDFIAEVPGYTLTASPEMKTEFEASRRDHRIAMFSEIGLWQVDYHGDAAGRLAVFLIGDSNKVEAVGGKTFFARTLDHDPNLARGGQLAGKSIFVSHFGGRTHLGWFDDSALIVVSGRSRQVIKPVAAALINR